MLQEGIPLALEEAVKPPRVEERRRAAAVRQGVVAKPPVVPQLVVVQQQRVVVLLLEGVLPQRGSARPPLWVERPPSFSSCCRCVPDR